MTKTNCIHLPGIAILLLAVFLIAGSGQVSAQQLKWVTGTVTHGTSEEKLSGVSVIIKGSKTGTATGNEGRYSIQVRNTDTLVFSYSGLIPQEIPVRNRTTIDVVLAPSTSGLDDVVVVGYKTVHRKDLTGAVGIVNINDINKAPVASVADALAGRVAGVQVLSSDGQPGSGFDIVIRGANSLTQSNSPLFVIDGFPIEDPDPAVLNPDDIESITILKDASSTAIYGSRGANGVVIIETKKGKIGKPVVTFNNQLGFQQLLKEIKLMTPYEFVKTQYEHNPQDAAAQYFINGRTLESYRDIPAFNLHDHLFRISSYRNHSIGVRGGSDQTRYSLSGSINDQEGIMVNSGFKRYQGRVSLDQALSPKFKTGVVVNYSYNYTYGQKIAAEPGLFTNSIMAKIWGYRPVTANPDIDLLEEEYDAGVFNNSDVRLNPIITSKNEHIVTKSHNALGNVYLQYQLTKGLVFKTTGSISNARNRDENFYNSRTIQGNKSNPQNARGVWGIINFRETTVWSNENTLSYTTRLPAGHQLSALAGFSMQGLKSVLSGHGAQNVPNEELGISGLDQGVPFTVISSETGNSLQSLFTRVDYNFKSRYILTGSFRADGSSKFAPGNRWAYFPAAGLRWNIHSENFMKALPAVSNAALRLSYGISGNNRVSDFAYLSSLSLPLGNSYSFNNGTPILGVISDNLGNNDLKWESTASTDLALEIGLFKNRIELTAEVYSKTTRDLLLNADLPSSTGFQRAFKNIGSIRNQGLELTLSTINISTKNFGWESNFNISFNRNKILELTQGQENLFTVVSFATGYTNPLYVSQIGQPAGMMYGYIFDGVYQYADFDNPSPGVYVLKNNLSNNGAQRATIKPGDIKYRDLNNDGVINTYDQTIIGNGQPLHTGGFVNNFRYRGFSLNIFLQWSYGNDIYNANRLMFDGNGSGGSTGGGRNQYASYNDRWSPENQTNKNFRAGGSGPTGMHSSRVVEDGSFLRLKTVSFGYSFPSRLIKKLSLSQLSVNLAAQNLLTFTNYSGVDPEVSTRSPRVLAPGFDFSAYPRARTVVFSLNATF